MSSSNFDFLNFSCDIKKKYRVHLKSEPIFMELGRDWNLLRTGL